MDIYTIRIKRYEARVNGYRWDYMNRNIECRDWEGKIEAQIRKGTSHRKPAGSALDLLTLAMLRGFDGYL